MFFRFVFMQISTRILDICEHEHEVFLYFIFYLKMYLAARIEHSSGPLLAREPYV